jgi:hypothetical protein
MERRNDDREIDPAAERRVLEGVREAESFFMAKGAVHHALEKLIDLLAAERIPYALIGAMALNEYGYRRVTIDVNLLLTLEGLEAFKRAHLGRGYVEKFPGSRGMRDTEHEVDIDVVIAGEYPGDGKPKPVAFPDPAAAAVEGARLRLLPLSTLIELKLASGMSAPHRLRDLADVLEVIRLQRLPEDFAARLDPSVRDKFRELWQAAQHAGQE